MLDTFPGESTVETKVSKLLYRLCKQVKFHVVHVLQILGLINNIAEVKTLRYRLMVDPFLQALHRLLRSPLIDVAYFAAGIVAHLASAGAELWTSQVIPRSKMLEELVLDFYV